MKESLVSPIYMTKTPLANGDQPFTRAHCKDVFMTVQWSSLKPGKRGAFNAREHCGLGLFCLVITVFFSIFSMIFKAGPVAVCYSTRPLLIAGTA